MHVGVEIFSCIFLLYTPLLTLSKHKGEVVHNKPQQMKVTYCRARKTIVGNYGKTKLYSVKKNSTGGFGGWCMSIHQNHSSN